jgi:uncharacterized membrane protein YedE/YeeE
MQAPAAGRTAVEQRFPSQQALTIGLAAIAIIGFGIYATNREFNLGAYWFIGVALGVILQRSRLCFAGAFRDLIMSGDARLMRALIVGLMVATVGFGLLMARFVPDPSFNVLPPGAHIQPVGYATVVGGVLFGIGMVLAGGCATGTLWRMGEGYLNSWVAMGGILVGLWAASKTWSWWWDNDISKREAMWLPTDIGTPVAILLTLGVLAAIYVGLLWWESRSPSLPEPAKKPTPPAVTVSDHLKRAYQSVFTGKGWSYTTGAIALGVLSIIAYNLQSPLGVTGGLALWGDNVAKSFSAGGLPLKGADALAGCTSVANADWLTIRTMTMSGLVLGAFSASVLSGEFKIRYSRNWARYPQLLIGGGLMGYASVIAIGCTVGAFFSSIPSLAVSGWLFGIALFGGAYLGVQLIRRLP